MAIISPKIIPSGLLVFHGMLCENLNREYWLSRPLITNASNTLQLFEVMVTNNFLKHIFILLHPALLYMGHKVTVIKSAFSLKRMDTSTNGAWTIANSFTKQWTSSFTLHHTNSYCWHFAHCFKILKEEKFFQIHSSRVCINLVLKLEKDITKKENHTSILLKTDAKISNIQANWIQ